MSYAVSASIQELVKSVILSTDTRYSSLETRAITYSDNTVNRELRRNNVPIPTLPNPIPANSEYNDLVEAGNLYAASFIINDILAGHERTSAASNTYRTDAKEFVSSYITYYNEQNSLPEDNEINTELIGFSTVQY